MTRQKAFELTKNSRISDDENSLCFKAMMIFWIGANYGYDKVKTAKTTKYTEDEVQAVFSNWEESKILVDGVIVGEFDGENDWMEVILISMCGAGELIRSSKKWDIESNVKKEKINNNMNNPKTLNEHLFAQLERLSSADETTISTEVDKAANIVMVSEQILKVARLKLDIMQAAGNLAEFSEIDVAKELPEGDDVKKKLLS